MRMKLGICARLVCGVLGATTFFLDGQAKADEWVNWDVKYTQGTGTGAPAGFLNVVLYGSSLSVANTWNGGVWWPNGEYGPPGTIVTAPAPTFSQFNWNNTTIGAILGIANSTQVTNLAWSFPTQAITVTNGIHIGANVTGSPPGNTPPGDPYGVATAFFSDANGHRLGGSVGTIMGMYGSYNVIAPLAAAASPSFPARMAAGQTVSVTVPVAVPAGSQVVLFHRVTDASGNFEACAFTELDPAPDTGASSVTLTATNGWIPDQGTASPINVSNVAYAVMAARVALGDLNVGNSKLTQNLVAIPIQPVVPAPALPPWGLAGLGGLLLAGGAAMVRRRQLSQTM